MNSPDSRMNKPHAFSLSLLPLLLLSACTTETGSYQDSKVYGKAVYCDVMKKSFEYEGPGRNPVIVIHGLLGSKLEDTSNSENIWGNFSLSEMLMGNKFAKLAHPMKHGVPLKKLVSSVKPSGLLDKSQIKVMGFSFDYEGYDILVRALKSSGYVPDSEPLPPDRHFFSQFIFYYDWRRDISENAARLQEFIQDRRKYLQGKYRELYGLRDHNVKFDLVAHSMGGLVARYFMRYGSVPLPDDPEKIPPLTWEGARFIDKVVIIATPNAGYVDTLVELTEGLRLTPAAPVYPKTIIGTFPSYYQMLPNAESNSVLLAGDGKTPVDYFSLDTWIRYGWGLADPNQDDWLKIILPDVKTPEERYWVALDHLDKCLKRAKQFKKSLQIPTVSPENVALYLIAGDALLTNDKVAVNPNGSVTVAKRDAGDGKITAMSARHDLRTVENWLPFLVSPINWAAVYHFQGGHMGIMNSETFETNLRFILLASPTPYQRKHMAEYSDIIKHRTIPNDDGKRE